MMVLVMIMRIVMIMMMMIGFQDLVYWTLSPSCTPDGSSPVETQTCQHIAFRVTQAPIRATQGTVLEKGVLSMLSKLPDCCCDLQKVGRLFSGPRPEKRLYRGGGDKKAGQLWRLGGWDFVIAALL